MADRTRSIEELNLIYSRLREKAVRLTTTLKKLKADVCWGWYAGHNADIGGVSIYEEFPIPVVTVNDVCEIGIDIQGMYIEGKIYTQEADTFEWPMLSGYDLTVCGASGYMNLLYDSRIDGREVLEDIMFAYDGEDSELCIDLLFPKTPNIEKKMVIPS